MSTQQPEPGRPDDRTEPHAPGGTGRGVAADPAAGDRAAGQRAAGERGAGDRDAGERDEGQRVVVVSPDGVGVAGGDSDEEGDPTDLIDQPAKVMRIGTMIKQLLDEVRNSPLDEAARARLAEIHERSVAELEKGLSGELVAELDRITLPFGADPAPTDAELRIAQAQLVGWLEGLFRGIQTAMVAQQVAAQAAQHRNAMRGLPPGADPRVMGPGPGPRTGDGTGQYL